MEQTIGVFGEEMLLWLCVLRQSPRRPPPEHVHRQANLLLDELKGSKLALELPVESVDDGMFAIAALLDEIAMSLPDLRPLWANHPLQATRWTTNNAGVELFQRLDRVRARAPRTSSPPTSPSWASASRGATGSPAPTATPWPSSGASCTSRWASTPTATGPGGVLKASAPGRRRPGSPPASRGTDRSGWAGPSPSSPLLGALTALTVILARNLG